MNFDEMKGMLEEDKGDFVLPKSKEEIRESKMPIRRIRQRMKGEIIVQLLAMVVFMTYPLIIEMHPLAHAAYYIFMFLCWVISFMYLLRMFSFLRKTSSMEASTRNTILSFIYEVKLTLEVYRTAVTAACALLPIPAFALLFGTHEFYESDIFSRWFMLDIPASYIFMLVIGYLLVTLLFYYITDKWVSALYVKEIKSLEKILDQLDEA